MSSKPYLALIHLSVIFIDTRLLIGILSTLFLLFPFQLGFSQNLNYDFHQLNSVPGLISPSYNNFVQRDSRGFIWIGSVHGLNRFDGIATKQFLSSLESGEGLVDNNIQSSFYEDKNGNIWFSTPLGLNQYDRKKNKFRTFQLESKSDKTDIPYHVFHYEKNRNLLWVMIDLKLCTFNIEKEKFSEGPATISYRFVVDTTYDGSVNRIFGFPWIMSSGLEVFTKNPDDTFDIQKYLALNPRHPSGQGPQISQGILQNSNKLWLISNQGLVKFNPTEPNKTKYFDPYSNNEVNLRNAIFYNKKELLLSSKDNGLWFFDTENEEFTYNWKNLKNSSDSLARTNPKELYIDSKDHIWVSYNHYGVSQASPQIGPFGNPLLNQRNPNITFQNLAKDLRGNIWAASQRQGVCLFDSKGSLKTRIPYKSIQAENEQTIDLRYFTGDNKGNLWLISVNQIYRLSPSESNWEKVVDSPDELFFLLPFKDQLFVTTARGMKKLEFAETKTILVGIDSSFSSSQVFEFSELFGSSNGNMIIPYIDKSLGVFSIDHKNELNSLKRVNPGLIHGVDASGIANSNRANMLWITTTRGPALLNENNFEIDYLLADQWDVEKGQISGLIEDKNGMLWIGTNKGLYRYEPATHALLKFTTADGLSSNDFSIFSALSQEDGTLWLTNANGLTVFHPDSVSVYPYAPNPYIDELLVNNAPYEGETYIGEETNISLDYLDNSLAFKLLAIGHYHADKSQVKYRMLNYDDRWTYIANGDFASFRKLSPGKYTLEFVAENVNGKQSSVKKLEITIKPPFYQTWWFISLVILALGTVLGLIFREYIQRKLRKQRIIFERAQAQQEERNRIAGELHDDLGSELSIIRFLSENVIQEPNETKRNQQLNTISNTAAELLDQTTDIIWTLNTDNDSLENLIDYLRTYSGEFLMHNQLDFDRDFPEDIPTLELSGITRRNILLIVKESLRNIIKHAQASFVRIKIELTTEMLTINIEDDGKGISTKSSGRGGNGLRNIHARAEAVQGQVLFESQPGEGTKVHFQVELDKLKQ